MGQKRQFYAVISYGKWYFLYDLDLQLNILHYQYSDLWDIDGDGDGIKDNIKFKSIWRSARLLQSKNLAFFYKKMDNIS